MHVEIKRYIAPEVSAAIYPAYVHAWDHLLSRAAARHVLSEAEFVAEMADERLEKIVVQSRQGDILGVTTITNDLSTIPWINDQFFLRRYPAAAARGALYYVGFAFVRHPERMTRALAMMAAEVDRRMREVDGVAGFDMCMFNVKRGIGRRMDRIYRSAERVEPLDDQTYYIADYQRVDGAPPVEPVELGQFSLTSLADRRDLLTQAEELLASRWPTFMLAGTPGHAVDLRAVVATAPANQLGLLDEQERLVGVGLSVPLRWDGTVAGLPAGWDDAVRASAELTAEGREPDTFCALSVTIATELTGRGLGGLMIRGMIDAARRAGAGALIAPVRPSMKAQYPLVPMTDYVGWQTGDGQVFDPWLRLHLRLGAELLTVAPESMTISGSIEEWEEWVDLELPGDGDYVIAGGLAPLRIDQSTAQGVYREANVWVNHPVRPVPSPDG